MIIPKKLKIGAHTVFVREVSGMIDSGNRNSKGEYIILLNRQLYQTEKEVTLFHEIIHVINRELPEQEVEFLAQAIYQVLKDNSLLR